LALALASVSLLVTCGSSSGSHGTGVGGGGGGGGAGGGNGGGGGGSGGGGGGGAGGAGGGNPDGGSIVAPQALSPNIVVDQFGYRPPAEKIAVIRGPQQGFDSGTAFTPGATYGLVDAHSGAKVLEAAPAAWNGGSTDSSSGDKAWWFDFSSVTAPGDYFVLDEAKNVRSDVFRIANDVYHDVLVQAVRMLYYQRDGMAKSAQNAGAAWADAAAHPGKCYLYSDAAKTLNKDLHGGWWDAGDFNKYTNWGASDVIELLHAYVDSPNAFGDDTNIPESGNGVPDLLDEVKWELDWIERMQDGAGTNGSVLSIVGEPSGNAPNTLPSAVSAPCSYGPASTSATYSSAAVLAYAYVVLKAIPAVATAYPGYLANLLTRAQNAWTWAQANPNVVFHNSQSNPTVGAGEQEVDSHGLLLKKVQAALYLFEATGTTSYRDFVDANYAQLRPIAGGYIDPSGGEEQETLLEYSSAANATASAVQAIKAAYKSTVGAANHLGSIQPSADPYGAYLSSYYWGSNQIKSDEGNLLYDVITFGVDASNNALAARGAERYVHYIHGVNPLGIVYLSNMGDFGAAKSVTRFFHSWFAKGSMWDAVGVSTYGPPPGYLTGGANPSYVWDTCCPGSCGGGTVSCGAAQLSPPAGQPAQKAYLDFNDAWPLDSWQITEPDDGYQAKYIRLLAKFAQ
jgi:hypothetical protein